MCPFPLQPLSICDHDGMQRGKARNTRKLLYRLREVGSKVDSMLDLVQVALYFFLRDCRPMDHRNPTAPRNSHPWNTYCKQPHCGGEAG